jgi:D-glycero-D-manno-heptose 1,7-bisphosphate phosphatase
MTHRRFVALDRDGTIIVERNYLSDPAEVELIPRAAEGLRKLQELGLGLIIVTNQSGIRRGFFDVARLELIHERMRRLLAEAGVEIDGIYVCPHTPGDNCDCRKPRPGLLATAANELAFVPRQCFVIGDKPCDIDLGRAVGAVTLLVRTGYGAQVEAAGNANSDYVIDDLLQAAPIIERQLISTPTGQS